MDGIRKAKTWTWNIVKETVYGRISSIVDLLTQFGIMNDKTYVLQTELCKMDSGTREVRI